MDLPREIWREVFQFCAELDLMRLMRVCKHFANIIIGLPISPIDAKKSFAANPPHYYKIWRYLKMSQRPRLRQMIALASQSGHIGLIRELFARLHLPNSNYFSPDPYIVHKTEQMLTRAFINTCTSGSVTAVEFMHEKLKEYVDRIEYRRCFIIGFSNACKKHLHIVKYLASISEIDIKYIMDYSSSLYNACEAGNNTQILEYLLTFNPKAEHLIRSAFRQGNAKIVEYLISKGQQFYSPIEDDMISGGNMDLIDKYIPEDRLRAFADKWLIFATEGNHIDLIRRLIALGARVTNTVLYAAANNGHIEAFKELQIAHGEIDKNTLRALCINAGGSLEMFIYIYSLDPTYLKQFNCDFYKGISEIDGWLLDNDPDLLRNIQQHQFNDMCLGSDMKLIKALKRTPNTLNIIKGFYVAYVNDNYKLVKHMICHKFINDNNIDRVIEYIKNKRELKEIDIDRLQIMYRIYSQT